MNKSIYEFKNSKLVVAGFTLTEEATKYITNMIDPDSYIILLNEKLAMNEIWLRNEISKDTVINLMNGNLRFR